MNLEQCLAAAKRMDDELLAPICARIERHDGGKHIYHLRWMVQEMHNSMSVNKAMRWLGYIQGALVLGYGQTLESMKKYNMEAVETHPPIPQHRQTEPVRDPYKLDTTQEKT